MKRRNELARARGFGSYAEQRRFGSQIRNRSDLEILPPAARAARQNALDALASARRHGRDLGTASAGHGTTPAAVAWWTRGAVRRQGGDWQISRGDRLYRSMYVISGGRLQWVDVRGNRVASQLGAHMAAAQHYRDTGDASRLKTFEGRSVGGYELETDPEIIDELARQGTFDFESIYRLAG